MTTAGVMTSARAAIVAPASRGASIIAPAMGIGMLGSGLVVVAIGAGGGSWAAPLLAVAGTLQLATGVLMLMGRAVGRAMLVPVVAVAPALLWVALIPLDANAAAAIPLLPMLASLALSLPTVAFPRVAVVGRLREGPALIGIIVAAVIVAFVATAALAGTPAGGLAVPHGEHGLVVDDHSGH